MRTLILNVVALTVGLIISTDLSANDFGFPGHSTVEIRIHATRGTTATMFHPDRKEEAVR